MRRGDLYQLPIETWIHDSSIKLALGANTKQRSKLQTPFYSIKLMRTDWFYDCFIPQMHILTEEGNE